MNHPTYAELISGLPEERKAELNLGMFKAYDIRTRAAKLSATLAKRLTIALGRYVKEILACDSIVLGRDARLAAPALMESAMELLPDMGLKVIANPLQTSTCQFYYACMKNPRSAAVMFTASHNPGDFIGLKILGPGMVTLAMDSGPGGGITGILAYYLQGGEAPPPRGGRGRVEIQRHLDGYIDYSMRLAGVEKDSLAGVGILADFLCGAAGTEVTEALGCAGARVRTRNLVPDGYFPAGDPNPIIPRSIQPTWDLMKQGGYDFGFCFDGDGDRMDIMDSRGEQLAPSFNLSILGPEILKYFRQVHRAGIFSGGSGAPFLPRMYADVKSNPVAMADQAAGGLGVHIIRNGHSFIKEALRVNFPAQYLFGAEESAHYYMNFPFDIDDPAKGFAALENTLYFTLLTARMWARHPGRYELAMARQNSVVRAREWPCHFLDESLMEGVMGEVEAAFRALGLSVFTTMEDGSSLDATLMRKGLPQVIDGRTDLSRPWYQVAQRISRSEEGMMRWEVVASDEAGCREAVAAIREITDPYVARGAARYE